MAYNILKGNPFSDGGSPPDGYFLAWNSFTETWEAREGPSGSFSAGGDLSGSSSSQTINAIKGKLLDASLSGLGPSENNYVLTWLDSDGYWAARDPGSSTFTAGGDLSGNSTTQTVIRINGATVPAAGSLVTGNVLRVSGTASLTYAAVNLAGGNNHVTGVLPTSNQAPQTMGGDVSGTTSSATVIRINGTSVPASPVADRVLVATSGTTTIWSQIYDGYIAANANITGSKIQQTSVSNFGVIQLGGDLDGSASSQVVKAIQTYPVNAATPTDGYILTWDQPDGYWVPRPAASNTPDATDTVKGKLRLTNDLGGTADAPLVTGLQSYDINSIAPADGYILTWIDADGYWAPRPGPSGSFSAGGDLSGSSTNQTVIGIQTNDVAAQVLGTNDDGYVLTWDDVDGYWAARPPTTFTAGGDLSGTNASQTVEKINGTSVPASPPTDRVLVATSGTTAIWSQIFDGYVAPTANIAGSKIEQTSVSNFGVIQIGGDLDGSASSQVVRAIQTYNVSNADPDDGYVLTWVDGDGYWAPRPTAQATPDATDIVKGKLRLTNDLGGTADAPIVTGLQSYDVDSFAPTDGYVLTWINADGYWAARPSTGGTSFTAGGDLAGTNTNQTVVAIQNNSVYDQTLDVPEDGYVLTWNDADGYWAAKPATGGAPSGSAGGDLSGTYPNPTVSQIEGNNVATEILGVAHDGYVLTWVDTDGYWAARSAAANSGNFGSENITTTGALNTGSATTTSLNTALLNLAGKLVMPGIPTTETLSNTDEGIIYFDSNFNLFRVSQNGSAYVNFITDGYSAGGDLSGTYPNPIVAQIQNYPVDSTAPTDGYVLIWDDIDGYWAPRPLFTSQEANPFYYGYTTGSLTFSATTWANVTTVATLTDGYTNGITRSGSDFTISKTGYYYLNSFFNTFGTGNYVAFRLRHSTGTLLQRTTYNNGAQAPAILQGIAYLTAGETYSIQYASKSGTPAAWNDASPIDGETMRTGEITIYYLPTESIVGSLGDGYQHLDILNGLSSNIGLGSNTFNRIGSIRINSADYNHPATVIFEGIFEATSGQTAELRLYNITDGGPVSGTTLTTTSNSSDYQFTGIALASGTKIYEAQIRITNGSPSSGDGVICSNAKIRIK